MITNNQNMIKIRLKENSYDMLVFGVLGQYATQSRWNGSVYWASSWWACLRL
jgi:hypothetical protein